MATLTDPGDVREDTRGQELGEKNSALHEHGAKPLSAKEAGTVDDMESHYNDPQDPSMGPDGPSGSGGNSGGQKTQKKSNSSSALNRGTGPGLGNKSGTKTSGGSSGNGKRFLVGGGLLGLILAIVIAFISLLPLKLESMMKNIFQKRIGSRVERYIETRSEKMLERYLLSSAGQTDAQFERNIVTMGEPIKDAFRTYRLNKFEAKLEANQGIKFQRGAGGGLDVYKDNKLVGNLADKEARAVTNKAIRDETKWYQVYQRRHLRQWMRNAYKISSWRFFDKKDGKDGKASVDNQLVDAAAAPESAAIVDLLDCSMEGTDCNTDEGDPEKVDANAQLSTADTPEAQSTASDTSVQTSVTDAQQTATKTAEDALAKDTSTNVSKILTKLLGDQIGQAVSKAFTAAAGPLILISAIDIASRIDHFIAPGTADKMITNAHKQEYAAQFAEWETIASDWKNGNNVSGDEFNEVMTKLEGIEQSAAFQDVFLNNTSGQKITSVSDGDTGKVTLDGTRSIDENSFPIKNWYMGNIGNIPAGPGFTIHGALELWYNTGRVVMDVVNKVIGWATGLFLSAVEAVFPPIRWLMDNIGHWLGEIIKMLIRPAVDGTEVGADLMNGIDAGGAVTGMDFARDLGAPHLSLTDANQLDDTIAVEQGNSDKALSLADRFFSPDYNHSLVNTLAIAVPSTPQGALNETGGYVASIASNPFKALGSLFSWATAATTHAATIDTPASNYGLIDWGYSNAQLDTPIDDAVLNQAFANAQTRLGTKPKLGDLLLSDCPKVADPTTQPNLCRLDITTLQSLTATQTGDDDGGINSGGQ